MVDLLRTSLEYSLLTDFLGTIFFGILDGERLLTLIICQSAGVVD
jgi:hypothetical protein